MAESQGVGYIIRDGQDTLSKSHKTISFVHHEIHEGNHYTVYCRSTASDTQTVRMIVRTSTGSPHSHSVFIVSARKGVELSLYEGSTNVAGGTTLTAYNNNRNSTNTPNAVIKVIQNPTVGATGTRIDDLQLGSSDVNPANPGLGGDQTNRIEWMLKEDSTYEIRAESLGANNIIILKNIWYEE